MTTVLIALAMVVAVAVPLFFWLRQALHALLERQAAALQALVQNQNVMQGRLQGVESQVGRFAQVVTEQLGQVHAQLQGGLADSARLASDAQKNVAAELRDSRAALAAINQSLGQFQEAGRELAQVSQALQTVLTGARTRGALGEVVLERMLEDALPQGHFELQYQFPSTGAKVDAVIRAGERLEKIVCVDSKFPREAYVRLVQTGEEARKDRTAKVIAITPLPVPTSRISCEGRRETVSKAFSTRISVSGRGTSTSGVTRKSNPWKPARPVKCWSGTPSPRRRRLSRKRAISPSPSSRSNWR